MFLRMIESEQLALVVDDEMQLKALEPAHRDLAPGDQFSKDFASVKPAARDGV